MTAFLLSLALTLGQTSPPNADIYFHDGSVVRMTLLESSVEVSTKYGTLKIPVTDIRRVSVGLHYPDGLEVKLKSSIANLSAEAYKEREQAMTDLLDAGPLAYQLLRFTRATDLEMTKRIEQLLAKISSQHDRDRLAADEDTVHVDFPIVGRLQLPTLKATSPTFGTLAIKLCDVREIVIGTTANAEFTIDAGLTFNAAGGRWLDTGVTLTAGNRFTVTAEGQVDLWPQGPGQYMTTPKGYTTAGKGSSYMAGTLIGKIGDGAAFVVGDRCDAKAAAEGRLWLQIVRSPWENASSGSYAVKVKTTPR